MMARGKAACEQIQALMTDIYKSGRSYGVIFSEIIVPTSKIEENLQKWPKSVLITLQKEDVFRNKFSE